MFKYNIDDIISIKNPIEISGIIFKRYINFGKNGISKISYDIEATNPNKTHSKYIILNILEEDIIGQEEINEIEIAFQFKYKIGDIIYALKNSYEDSYDKGIIIDQTYSESNTKIDYKYKIAIKGHNFIVQEKYLIDKDKYQAIILEKEKPIIEPKSNANNIHTHAYEENKEQKLKEDIDTISYKLNILIEKIDHLDDRITDLEENRIKENQLIKILEDSEDRVINDLHESIVNNSNEDKLNILIEKIDHMDNKITDIENDLGNFGNNIDENNNLLNSIDNTKLDLLIKDSENNIIGDRAMLDRINNQFKELKDYINIQLNSINSNRTNY